jgi:hypothetical protein
MTVRGFCSIFERQERERGDKYVPRVVVDCANGAGFSPIEKLRKKLSSHVQIEIVNSGESGKLNFQVRWSTSKRVQPNLSINVILITEFYGSVERTTSKLNRPSALGLNLRQG